ncbi:hypothetical protein Kpol_1072p24 [Vanderwaltozyma polyspora DSM 70294]|uniref:Uncharacterized protein n=1 Tax=Vanderwaltozyma polyspora (strain ATCC 22028 / DSM 70294 / BCRC 21397 / CBS 2163 / NBRC 10782 / NRRL Y-8283 / UCD 57-17) TaxID=436907 RepID=A7TKP2_VANPO|nr:uncharacterized protein Kpol_1072p24 [Vanderwaltozyma polyspora DSM 70294]EDO17154.1 hypothetical protein Kpol_1072p24 [Vanderwaltozyma polyspora DSM 70294]
MSDSIDGPMRLIMVPCHGIWNPLHRSKDGKTNLGQDQSQWYLAPFQIEGYDHISMIKHGLAAINELLNHLAQEKSVVIFSGSQTKSAAGCLSEAQSYYLLMWNILKISEDELRLLFRGDNELLAFINEIHEGLLKNKISVDSLFEGKYITTEEFALDSFDNLLYSIYRFKQFIGYFPSYITIVGFGFKEDRFRKFHAKAIDFDSNKLKYISIDPNPLYESYLNGDTNFKDTEIYQKYMLDLNKNEFSNAVNLFEKDWYGNRNVLLSKKITRNCQNRYPAYDDVKILQFNEKLSDIEYFEQYVEGKMPWSLKH